MFTMLPYIQVLPLHRTPSSLLRPESNFMVQSVRMQQAEHRAARLYKCRRRRACYTLGEGLQEEDNTGRAMTKDSKEDESATHDDA